MIDFGAKNDGSAPATEAFAKAIQAAKAAGGGTVFVPAGEYLCGPIALVSNLTLDLDAGAVLRFPAARLPFAKSRVQGIECLAPVPLVGGENLENVAITGRGTLTTDNNAWLDLMGRPTPETAAGPGSAFGPDWNNLLAALQTKTPRPEAEYLKVAPYLRPAFIRFTDCKNIDIEGIRVAGSPFWTIHLLYSQNASVRNVSLETFPGAFTGGIYIDSSRDVRVAGCVLDCGDDAIVLKAGKDADGLRINRPAENVTISDCIVKRGSGAIVMGSETSGWIRNVAVSNVVCQGTQYGINIKSKRGRGGGIENVRIDNVTMQNVGIAISVSEYFQMQGEKHIPEEPVSARTPVFRNLAISHVTIDGARGWPDFSWNPDTMADPRRERPTTIEIAGLPERPIDGLRISDVVASGAGGLRASNANALQLSNIEMNVERGPAFLLLDSNDLNLDGVASRKPAAGAPVIRLDACPGAVVRNSRAHSGTGTFLSAGPGELKSIMLEGNALGGAKEAAAESKSDFWNTPEPPAKPNGQPGK